MSHFILTSQSPTSDFISYGGGKAKNLSFMSSHRISVPTWFCVADTALQSFLAENSLHAKLRPEGDLAKFAAHVAETFAGLRLSDELRSTLEKTIREMKLDDCFLAVRSSGIDEDSRDHSFAGLFSSFLFQKGIDAIEKSILQCWASAFSERALKYRIERGLPTTQIHMGVVIQKMVDSESSGVAFSRNPIKSLDRKTLIVDSVWGLGEGLVSGELDADHFVISRDDFKIEADIVKKSHAFRQAPEGGVRSVPLDDELILKASLTSEQVAEVARLAIQLEALQGCAQDVEWAYADGKLHCLQTRPVTTLPPEAFYDAQVNGNTATLWDNSNIVESYGGVTSPFTFSFASFVYREVYRQFFEMMAVPKEVQEANEKRFRNMLGLIRGRIYYNLIHWYGCLLLLPGTASNQAFMETMMGVKQTLSPEHQKVFDFMKHPPKYGFFTRMKLLFKSIERFYKADGIIRDFKHDFNRVYGEARKKNYAAMPLQEQIDYYFFLQDQWLKRWKAPIINDFLCMIFFGMLKKLTQKWIEPGDAGSSLQNDLLCGQGDLESTEPTKRLMRIAETIDRGPEDFRTWFMATPQADVWEELKKGKKSREVLALFLDFLDRYGFRCVNELKLEEFDLHDDPSFVVGVVTGYVRMKSYSIEAMVERESQIRDAAEGKVLSKISGPKRLFYFWVLKHARKAVRNREDLRFDRTKVFGIIRYLFRAIGGNFKTLGLIDEQQDVFYLTMDEIIAYIEGRSIIPSFRETVKLRKTIFDDYRNTPSPPDRFVTYGAVGTSQAYPQVLMDGDLEAKEAPKSNDPNVLIGTPCCPGIIEGIVRVAHTLQDTDGMAGEILVTYRTDPGWVPLYPSCAGLVIERGSLLSHSAVVARELGLPTIVGVSGGLMKRLKSGMRVRVDAGRGEIRILEETP